MINKIIKSQEFCPQDNLTRLIVQYDENAMTVEELDMVFAASSPKYDEFQKLIKRIKNK